MRWSVVVLCVVLAGVLAGCNSPLHDDFSKKDYGEAKATLINTACGKPGVDFVRNRDWVWKVNCMDGRQVIVTPGQIERLATQLANTHPGAGEAAPINQTQENFAPNESSQVSDKKLSPNEGGA